jgi:staphylococcal nuclease domain-containing protein 1
MPDLDFNAMSFLSSIGKGKPIKGVVEAVLNGSTLRLTLPENNFLPVTVALAGVQAPSMGKRPPAPAAAAEGEAPPAEAAPQPEPFAREAKWFSESRVLNQEVRVVLEGVDKYNNLFGSVVYSEPDGKLPNLAEQLAAAGLAKVGNSGKRLGYVSGLVRDFLCNGREVSGWSVKQKNRSLQNWVCLLY